jgi:hypothetical protein
MSKRKRKAFLPRGAVRPHVDRRAVQIYISCPFFRRENSMRRDYEQAQAVMQVVLLVSMIVDHSFYSAIRGCGI